LPVGDRAPKSQDGHRQQKKTGEAARVPLPRKATLESPSHLTTICPALASILASTDCISAKP
jgi:hypothetical protein